MLVFLRGRREAFILPAAYLVLVIFLYGSINGIGYRGKRLGSPSAHQGTRYALIANSTHSQLEAIVHEPIDISDFAGMGDRMALFSRLAHAVTQDETLDHNPLLTLLREQFHWWEPAWSIYAPWNPRSRTKKQTTGIVICVGANNFIYAGHLIRTLRKTLNSTLPIQIAYSGEADLPFEKRAALKALDNNIQTLNLLDYFDDHIAGLQDGGFAQKPFAMLASRFQKVILLDADTIFLQNPDRMFEREPGLTDTGMLFWHDRAFRQDGDSNADRHSWIRGLMSGREPSRMLNQSLFWTDGVFHEMESGAVCMDKGRSSVFMSLVFSAWMNTREVRSVTYAHTYGDKETFWLAAELSGAAYHFNPIYGGIMGYTKDKGTLVCSSQLLHLDGRKKKPLWLNSSLRRNKHNQESREFATLTHWMVPGYNMSQQIDWHYRAEDGLDWCAHGGEALEMSTEELRVIDDMIGESMKVDDLLLPPPPKPPEIHTTPKPPEAAEKQETVETAAVPEKQETVETAALPEKPETAGTPETADSSDSRSKKS